jgi:Domain of unknown function (DUF3850)
MRHGLKCWPEYFNPILWGTKTFEIRKNDRSFHVGDELLLKEWDPKTQLYTGREILCAVPYLTSAWLLEGYVVMAIKIVRVSFPFKSDEPSAFQSLIEPQP